MNQFTLFKPPEVMRKIRAGWQRDNISPTLHVRELVNGGYPAMQLTSVPCYVRFIQAGIVEVELTNDNSNISDYMKWRQEVVETVLARLRLWGVNNTMDIGDDNNVYIRYRYGDQLTGGDDLCKTDTP